MARAQAALEFMILTSLALLLFSIILFAYFQEVEGAAALKRGMGANTICLQAASTIDSFAALGGSNSTYSFGLPPVMDGGVEYTVRVLAAGRQVRVDYGGSGASCALHARGITNSTGSADFVLDKNANMSNNGGAIVVTP